MSEEAGGIGVGGHDAAVEQMAAWMLYERRNMDAVLARHNRRGRTIFREEMEIQLENITGELEDQAAYAESRTDGISDSEEVKLSLAVNREAMRLIGHHLHSDIADFTSLSRGLDDIAEEKERHPFEGGFTTAKDASQVAAGIDFMTAKVVDYALEQSVIADPGAYRFQMVDAIDRLHGELKTRTGPVPFTKLE